MRDFAASRLPAFAAGSQRCVTFSFQRAVPHVRHERGDRLDTRSEDGRPLIDTVARLDDAKIDYWEGESDWIPSAE